MEVHLLSDKVDGSYKYENEKRIYPYILLEEYPNEIGILLSKLKTGTLPVALVVGGEELKLSISIEKTLYTLGVLIAVVPIIIKVSKGVAYKIQNAEELLEVDIDWRN